LAALLASERSAREAAVSRVRPLLAQIRDKNACLTALHDEGPSLKHALSSSATRHQLLLPALVECLAPGIVAAAKAEAARPHPLAFQSLSGYTHGAFLSRVSQDSASLVTGQEASMGFVVALAFALIDRAHLLFSPNSVTSLPASPSSTTTPQKATGALRYQLARQNAVAVSVASVLNAVDYFFRWEYGWMLTLEAKKLAHSDRLTLIISKTLPAPSPSALLSELTKQVARAQAAGVDARTQPSTITLDTFDNVSSGFGYIRKTSRAGEATKALKNPVATAWSTHHFTLTEHGANELRKLQSLPVGVSPLNPLRRPSNSPIGFIPTTAVAADYYKLLPAEHLLLVAEWKLSLGENLADVLRSGEHVPLVAAADGAAAAVCTKKCFYCQRKWPVLKRNCYNEADKTGCGKRILGPLADVSGVAVFDDVKVEPRYAPSKLQYSSASGTMIKMEMTLSSFTEAATLLAPAPFWFEHNEEVHQILPGNPGATEYNRHILNTIGQSNFLRGHVDPNIVIQEVGFVCSDGGADFMANHGVSDFGQFNTQVPIIASGHEDMNFLKALLKVAFHLGAGVFASFHTWSSSRAQETLMSGCDTHKAIEFLLEVCRSSVETALVHEWIQHASTTAGADSSSVEEMWAWIESATDVNFINHVHFWIKSLGALSLLRKAVRSHDASCHLNYRAAQKFLLPYFFACHATGWGPLLLRDIRIVDFQLTDELRAVYK